MGSENGGRESPKKRLGWRALEAAAVITAWPVFLIRVQEKRAIERHRIDDPERTRYVQGLIDEVFPDILKEAGFPEDADIQKPQVVLTRRWKGPRHATGQRLLYPFGSPNIVIDVGLFETESDRDEHKYTIGHELAHILNQDDARLTVASVPLILAGEGFAASAAVFAISGSPAAVISAGFFMTAADLGARAALMSIQPTERAADKLAILATRDPDSAERDLRREARLRYEEAKPNVKSGYDRRADRGGRLNQDVISRLTSINRYPSLAQRVADVHNAVDADRTITAAEVAPRLTREELGQGMATPSVSGKRARLMVAALATTSLLLTGAGVASFFKPDSGDIEHGDDKGSSLHDSSFGPAGLTPTNHPDNTISIELSH